MLTADQIGSKRMHTAPILRTPLPPNGAWPKLAVWHAGHTLVWSTYSIVTGGGGGATSVTCRRSDAATGVPAKSHAQPAHTSGGQAIRSSGASTSRIVAPGVPGCLPGRRPVGCRNDRSVRFGDRGCLANTPSELGGFDEFEESRRV